MSKAKTARVANVVTLRCVELGGRLGYEEQRMLANWARRLLGKRSTELG